MILADSTNEIKGLPADSPELQTLEAVRTAAEAKALLSETLCAMESEVPAVKLDGEGGVELAMAVLKAIRQVDPEGMDGQLGRWRARCERVLNRALEGNADV